MAVFSTRYTEQVEGLETKEGNHFELQSFKGGVEFQVWDEGVGHVFYLTATETRELSDMLLSVLDGER